MRRGKKRDIFLYASSAVQFPLNFFDVFLTELHQTAVQISDIQPHKRNAHSKRNIHHRWRLLPGKLIQRAKKAINRPISSITLLPTRVEQTAKGAYRRKLMRSIMCVRNFISLAHPHSLTCRWAINDTHASPQWMIKFYIYSSGPPAVNYS